MPQSLDRYILLRGLEQPVSTHHSAGRMVVTMPHLAARVAAVIAVWSETESLLVSLLARLLPREWLAVSAISASMRSYQVHKSALMTAAGHSLNGPLHDLFRAVLESLEPAYRLRNQFAHGIWHFSPQISDALLWVKAALMTATLEASQRISLGIQEVGLRTSRYSDTLVWTAPDLDEALTLVEEAGKRLTNYSRLLHPLGPRHGQTWSDLWNDPIIQAELSKIYAPIKCKPLRATRAERAALTEKLKTPPLPPAPHVPF